MRYRDAWRKKAEQERGESVNSNMYEETDLEQSDVLATAEEYQRDLSRPMPNVQTDVGEITRVTFLFLEFACSNETAPLPLLGLPEKVGAPVG